MVETLSPVIAPALQAGEVQVWYVHLDLPELQLAELRRTLSPDEEVRAHRYHFPRDQRRFVAARGTLRTLLGRYLECAPEAVPILYGEAGKPEVAGVTFNVSHSADAALLAFHPGAPLGIDLEQKRPLTDALELAEHYFSPAEVAALRALPEPEQMDGFYQAWTRKEAYLKGRGTGLPHGTRHFTVTLGPSLPPQLLSDEQDPTAPAEWTLHALPMPPGYVACLAVDAQGQEISVRQFPVG